MTEGKAEAALAASLFHDGVFADSRLKKLPGDASDSRTPTFTLKGDTLSNETLPKTPKFDAQGLIPVVVQDATSQQILMLAYMNREAYELTLQTRQAHFWSRSRKELWHKGATSGNTQTVVEIFLDCDQDALLLRVHPAGPACHTGLTTCFHNPVEIK